MHRLHVQPVINRAPQVNGLYATAIIDNGRSYEWCYYHPDDCTLQARHIKVRMPHDDPTGTTLNLIQGGLRCREGHLLLDGAPSFDKIVKAVASIRDVYLKNALVPTASEDERDAARQLVDAGFQPPSMFKDAWTCATELPDVFYYVRRRPDDRECDDGHFIVNDSFGPVISTGPVEAGIARWTGTHRVFTIAPGLQLAMMVVELGELHPQTDYNNPSLPKGIPMYALQWTRDNPEKLHDRRPGF